MNEIATIVTISRAWSLDSHSQRGFSIQIAVARVGADASALPDDVLPWEQRIRGFRLRTARGELSLPIADSPMDAHLGAAATRLLATANESRWTATPVAHDADQPETLERAPDIMAYLSTFPAPIPQQLGLSFLVSIEASQVPDDTRLWLVPEYDGLTLPADPMPTQQDAGEIIRLEYVQNAPIADAPRRTVYLRTFHVVDASSNPPDLVDCRTLYVAKARQDWVDNDWTVQLERASATMFELPRLLLAAAAEKNAAAPLDQPSEQERRDFARVVVGTLRDVTGLGILPTRSGDSLLGSLANELAPSSEQELVDALARYDRRVGAEPWAEQLQRTVDVQVNALGKAPLRGKFAEDLDQLTRLVEQALTPATLRLVVSAQWKAALTVDTWTELLEKLPTALSNRPVGELLGAGLLSARSKSGRSWSARIDAKLADHPGHEPASLPAIWIELVLESFDSRSAGTLQLTPPIPALPAAFREPLRRAIEKRAHTLIATLTARGGDDVDGPPTKLPHPIHIQVARLAHVDEAVENLPQIDGFGILMREDGKPWRYLNAARLEVSGHPDTPLRAWTAIPLGMSFVGTTNQPFRSYDNHHLGTDHAALEMHDAQHPSSIAPWFRYRELDRDVPWGVLPALKFGAHYSILAHAFGKGGVLPRELRGTDATTLAEPADVAAQLEPLLADPELERSLVRHVHYVRRVPIGEPRLERETTYQELPPLPDDLHPLSNELSIPVPVDEARAQWPAPRYGEDAAGAFGTLPFEGPWVLSLNGAHGDASGAEPWSLNLSLQHRPASADVPAAPVTIEIDKHATELVIRVGSATHRFDVEEPFDLRVEPTGLSVRRSARSDAAPGPWQSEQQIVAFSTRSGAIELEATRGAVRYMPPRLSVAGQKAAPEQKAPLLLCHHRLTRSADAARRKARTFSLRPPAIDRETWRRWVLGGDTSREELADAWALLHEQLDDPAADTTLDDPAACEYFHVELVPVYAPGARVETTLVPIPRRTDAAATNLQKIAQRSPVQITVTATAQDTPTVLGPLVDTRLTVEIAAGEIWELRVFPMVKSTLFTTENRRFSRWLCRGRRTIRLADGTEWVLMTPFRQLIETATQVMPTAQGLYDALRTRFERERVELLLDHSKLDALRWLGRIDVQRQVWRWDGRPLHAPQCFPEDARWEAEAFGTRRDDDAATTSTLSRHPADDAEASAQSLFTEDRTGRAMATYYRFAATATSRYAPWVATAVRGTDTLEPHEKGVVAPTRSWHGQAIPLRWNGAVVPKPRVKLVVPLTGGHAPTEDRSALSSAELSPGFLVVLDEPWFELGGPGEHLVAELVRTPDGKPETGMDPIVALQPTKQTIPELVCDGPLGHTFDGQNDAALFLQTSFVLRADTLPPWTMSRVRFGRRLEAGPQAPASELSAPFWIQALPDVASYSSAAELDLTVVDARGRIETQLKERVGNENRFSYWLLITFEVFDARGKASEAYVDIVKGTDLTFLLKGGSSARYYVRYLEVQSRVHDPLMAKPLDLLFPDETSTEPEPKARILGIGNRLPLRIRPPSS